MASSSPYQEFVQKAKARYEANKKKKLLPKGGIEFTAHARYKMSQYGLSEQKIKGVLRHPTRTEIGIAPRTVAVMQPVGQKHSDIKSSQSAIEQTSKGTWKQEIWVMFVKKKKSKEAVFAREAIRIVSAWRYPGVSPKRSPVPREILQELESGDILDMFEPN